jgi:hypothetical protein
MARSQFSYQKRQKELAKKKKREEKQARRQERKLAGGDGIATVNEFGEVIEPPAVEEEESETEDLGEDLAEELAEAGTEEPRA